MTRKEYTDTVLSALRHVTGDERAAIQEELEAHMEDHLEALLALDYPQELAEERTLSAMGDPKEVGRALNRQYTGWGWVILERAALALTVVLCIQAVFAFGMLGMLLESVTVRFAPSGETRFSPPLASQDVDIRVPVGDDILRVYQVNVGPDSEVPGGYRAEVLVCAYDRIPGGIVSERLTYEVRLENARGERSRYRSGSGNWRVEYARLYTPLQPGDTCVTLEYEGFGEQVSLELPLPEGGIP